MTSRFFRLRLLYSRAERTVMISSTSYTSSSSSAQGLGGDTKFFGCLSD